MSLSSAMNVATSSLLTSQNQLTVITTNISNADNPDYHLRKTTVENLDCGHGSTAVFISLITRAYDAALEGSLRDANSSYSYRETYLDRINEVEGILGPNGENSLNKAVLNFASSLQSIATDPESISARSSLLEFGEALAAEFNVEYSNLATLRNAIASNDSSGNGYLEIATDEVNSLLNQIANLNKSINNLEDNDFSSQQALDLRDERDALVKKLSNYIDVEVTEEDNTQYTVEMKLESGSVTLIDGTQTPQTAAEQLAVNMVESPAGFFTPEIVLQSAPTTSLALNSESGSIRALIDCRDYISTQMGAIYNFASELATQINNLQNSATAYDLDGNNNAGNLFLVPSSQPASGNIMAVLISDARKIAASDTVNQSGNGDNMTAIWNKLNEAGLYNDDSLIEYSDRILSNVAVEVNKAANAKDTAENVLSMYQSAVAEKSSVSIDEEMINMLEVEKAYQAASKVITTIDKMIDIALNMV